MLPEPAKWIDIRMSVNVFQSQNHRIVQKVINDTVKEHLFGPDLTSTDENSPHSPESGDEGMCTCMFNRTWHHFF